MRRLTWSSLIILILSVCRFEDAEGCSCTMSHPQTQFCQSDWVAVVRIKKFVEISDHEAAYKFKLHRIFKATPKAEHALKQHLMLWTPSMDSLCGRVNMEPGETWVVGGRMNGPKPHISLCNLAMRWSEVTGRQRKGFRQFYNHGCVCHILYTQWWNKGAVFNSTGGKGCLWESAPGPSDCQERYGICMMGPAGCSWVPSVAYKKCVVKHQRDREQQLAREP
ncbi:tissue inhibitor of metalloproteases [Fopius arisanus]|uniref:Timp_0 protein n=1 Tax=Fopius arisanus TaxID=64838 RepID=A0A0C9QB21_9HYME|nr:PREDICTED: tissue inhibitor of metalloproteases [Fopius arisanus]XP_011297568.1 PREDICTED: tissue inhibitor of metalloproteases [Fopius arisanus]XP_011297569.1 PREDICTED: tissue inhibitor of metalloproteases [Fopius arisanus]